MSGFIRQVRVLLPAGVISYNSLKAKAQAQQARDGDSRSPEVEQALVKDSLGAQLARQLEAWLLPANKAGSIGAMFEEFRNALAEETHLTPEESQRLPVNLLMLKAMHDRELLEAKDNAAYHLDREDRKVVIRAAHFSTFATAAYGIMGNLRQVQAMVIEEATIPPPELLMNKKDYLQKWFVSKHTGISLDDVKQVDTSGSVETPAYFVAVDHSTNSVVLSIRGTFSLFDAVIDLLCRSVDFGSGKAHEGIAHSTVSVWATVKDQVEELLREHNDYQLVITGHSLGAGAAILLKHLFDFDRKKRRSQRGRDTAVDDDRSTVQLDIDREVHIECYAFAPPPVFAGNDAANMRDTFSFIHRFDCVPTASLTTLRSIFGTARSIDRLPLDVYERAAYILDSRVRVQQGELGLEAEKTKGHRADRLVNSILELTRAANIGPLFREGNDGENEPARGSTQTSASDVKSGSLARGVEKQSNVERDASATIPDIEKNITRFTYEIKDAAKNILDAADSAGKIMDRFYDGVGRVTNDMLKMSSEEIALTALLVQGLAAGKRPSPDEVHSMVRDCQKEEKELGKEAFHDEITFGDLVIPGKVYWLEGSKIAAAAGVDPGKDGDLDRVRRTSSAELGGMRLCNSMLDDHFMEVYEDAMVAAAQRYQS